MSDFFVSLLFGHLVGDYLFQTNKMALNKKKDVFWLGFHCLVYTFFVGLFTISYIPNPEKGVLWAFVILLSHAFLDGTDIVDKWLNLIGSRSYDNSMRMWYDVDDISGLSGTFAVSYTAIVQTVADNTLHLLMMYYGYKLYII